VELAGTPSTPIALAILYKLLIINLYLSPRASERPVDASKPRMQAVGAKSGAVPCGTRKGDLRRLRERLRPRADRSAWKL